VLIVDCHTAGVMMMTRRRTVNIGRRRAGLHRRLVVSLTGVTHTIGSLMHLRTGPGMTGAVSALIIGAALDAARRSTRSRAIAAAGAYFLVFVRSGLIL
jgi:hypothetical protein